MSNYKPERVVKKFYEGLAEHKLYGRKCKQCGAIEYPPRYACNTCGYHETEWVELSGKGKLQTLILTSTLNADPWNAKLGKYGYGLVQLEEGPMFNCTVFGLSKKTAKVLRPKLPVSVHPKFVERDEGYTTVFFEVDEEELKN